MCKHHWIKSTGVSISSPLLLFFFLLLSALKRDLLSRKSLKSEISAQTEKVTKVHHDYLISVCVYVECALLIVLPGVVCQKLQSTDVTVLNERMFIVTCFSTRELFKKTSREGRINRIKPKEKTDKDKYCKKEYFLDSLGFLSVEIKILLSLYVNSQFFPPP